SRSAAAVLSQSIKSRGRARVPSSPIDVLARHREDVTLPRPSIDLPDLPTLAELLNGRRPRRYGRRAGSCRLQPFRPARLVRVVAHGYAGRRPAGTIGGPKW